jgi:hypothetical protein
MLDGGAVIVADQARQCKSGTSDLCSWDGSKTTTGALKFSLRLEHVSAACIQEQLTPQASFASMRTDSRNAARQGMLQWYTCCIVPIEADLGPCSHLAALDPCRKVVLTQGTRTLSNLILAPQLREAASSHHAW